VQPMHIIATLFCLCEDIYSGRRGVNPGAHQE
jgi:hypothetical protein